MPMLSFLFTYAIPRASAVYFFLSICVTKGLPLVLLVGQVCWQQILRLFAFLGIASRLLSSRPALLDTDFLAHSLLSALRTRHPTASWPPRLRRTQLHLVSHFL